MKVHNKHAGIAPPGAVNVEVRHNPDDHSWRIFHILRNGLIVSRSEQYSILDASGSGRTQWRGSLNRQRNLYMIGEIKVDDAGELTWNGCTTATRTTGW